MLFYQSDINNTISKIFIKKYLKEAYSSINDREFGINYDSAVNSTSSSANLMMPNPPPPSWWSGKNRLSQWFAGERMPDWYRRMFGYGDPPADRPRLGSSERGVERAPRGPGSNFSHNPLIFRKPGGQYNGYWLPPKEFPVYSHQAEAHTLLGLDRSRFLTTWEGQALPQGVFVDSHGPPHLFWTLGAPTPDYPEGVPYWIDYAGEFTPDNPGVWRMINPELPGNPWGIQPPDYNPN